MLSPVGKSFPIASDPADNRRSREVIVVEDLPNYLDRIREQVALIDLPPRHVLIHVYVLQVEMGDENKHGVDFEHTFNMTSNLLRIETSGFANSSASQAFFFNVSGGNLSGLLEILQSTTDSNTLASPKILCLNGQTSRLQVGEQLGFRVTTTTETSTLESVEFLDVGVVLEVTPRISRDGHVILRISPEVSSGEVSASTGLPEEATTELETDVLLGDNQGVVIGGLIQKTDSDKQSKLPWLGDLHYLGKMFQRKETAKKRSEIFIALLPRVVPFETYYEERVRGEVLRAQTPLLHGPLHRTTRPWEPRLHDALDHPRRIGRTRRISYCRQCDGLGCGGCQWSTGPVGVYSEQPVQPWQAEDSLPSPNSEDRSRSSYRSGQIGQRRARRLPPVGWTR